MNISLPIKIFEPRSFLEKVAADFALAPYFLDRAGEMTEPFDRFKQVVTWLIASCHLEPQMIKPFNPILGETFQGSMGGYKVYVEQISHHPPISAFEISADAEKPSITGYFEFEAATGIRKMTGFKKGRVTTRFPDGQEVSAKLFPNFEMHGMMRGTRTFSYLGDFKIVDEGNGYYADIIMNPERKGWFKRMFGGQKSPFSSCEGIVTNVRNFDFRDRRGEDIKKMIKESGGRLKVHSTIEGDWLDYLKFGKEKTWTFD
jgi:hypothetical protein